MSEEKKQTSKVFFFSCRGQFHLVGGLVVNASPRLEFISWTLLVRKVQGLRGVRVLPCVGLYVFHTKCFLKNSSGVLEKPLRVGN